MVKYSNNIRKTKRNKIAEKSTNDGDFVKDYNAFFVDAPVNPIKPEWTEEGDVIKQFSLYEDPITP